MIIKKEITIDSDIDSCWDVLGKDFANPYKWASSIQHSEGTGNGFNGAPCSDRACDVQGMGALKEKLLVYSDVTHSLKYEIIEGLPSIVKKGTNSWSLSTKEDNRTTLTMEMYFDNSSFIGTLMKPIMKFQMSRMAHLFLEEFKYYLEKGTPHPRKFNTSKHKARAKNR